MPAIASRASVVGTRPRETAREQRSGSGGRARRIGCKRQRRNDMGTPPSIDSRDATAERDRADPLASFRAEFLIPDDEIVYMDGNSLGRPLRAVGDALARVVGEDWGARLIRSWTEGWMELPLTLGDQIGALLGAAAGQVAVADSTTVCFYKAASAALDARPGRLEIVTDRGNFPTDRYVLESLAAARGLRVRWLEPADRALGPSRAEVAAVLSDETALVTFTHVD
jgi:kynureninase